VNFLHPYFSVAGILLIALILINKKIKFTHLNFFKTKKFNSVNILDLLIALSLTALIAYPVTSKSKTITSIKNYSFSKEKKTKRVIIILDVSLSMKEFFDEAKEKAKEIALKNKNAYIMVVVFEKDYKIIQPFTDNISSVLTAIDSAEMNMVTHIGGSMLRDTLAGIINSFKNLNPQIYLISDGSNNDESSVSKDEIKNLSKDVSIRYIGYGKDPENIFYSSIFKFTPAKTPKPVHSRAEIKKSITYESFDERFIYLALALLLIKLIRERFEKTPDIA